MSSEGDFPQHGIIVPKDSDSFDHMNTMAHAILDDVMYNLIHDIVLDTHRREKIQRANTAGIIVEHLAAETPDEQLVEPDYPTTPKKKRKVVHTKGAIYDDGNVYIVGNPLETTKEIRCAQCGLPRLVFPPIGPSEDQPDPSIKYCQRKPFINLPGQDIYGQPLGTTTREPPTKKGNTKTPAATDQAEAGSSFDSPGPSPPPAPDIPEKKPTKTVLPKLICPECKRLFSVIRFGTHLFKCMQFGGRASGRAAALKINEQQTGSQRGSTPPISRRSTPLPPEKKIPQKRDMGESGNLDSDKAKTKQPKKEVAKKAAPKKEGTKKEVTKKWKSGNVTVNGKAVATGQVPNLVESESVPSSQSRAASVSSQTLSSP